MRQERRPGVKVTAIFTRWEFIHVKNGVINTDFRPLD